MSLLYFQTVNITWMSYNASDENMCLCVESFTYTHKATSPAFAYGLGYDSTNYSTWTESMLVWVEKYVGCVNIKVNIALMLHSLYIVSLWCSLYNVDGEVTEFEFIL